MTREQAIIILDCERPYASCGCGASDEEIEEALNMAIEALEQEPKWIPANEQLPKESGKYLVTFGGTHHIGIDFYSTEEDAKKIFEEPEEDIGWRSHNVVAWLPLPESYKSESEG